MEIPKFLLGLIIAFLGSSGIISCFMWCKEEKRANFIKKKVVGRTVQAYVLFDENYKGKITDIRVIDKDGDIVAQDPKVYERVSAKALYVAFKHEFTEV